MIAINDLFELSKQGLAFHGVTTQKVGMAMEAMLDLPDFKRLLKLLDILHDLSTSNEYTVLNAEGFSISTEVSDNDRINKIFNYIKNHYQETISLEEISDLAGMTEPSFCRYFKKTTSKTFTQFVNEYRLVHASKLLAENNLPITEIAFECGFQNFSHFSRSFKKFTGVAPLRYRHQMKNIIEA